MVISKGVQVKDVIKMFTYLMPALLIFSIPISILTATLLSFGRLSFDNEITAIRSSGISLYQIVFDLLLVGLLFSLICLYFNDTLIPQSHYKMRTMIKEIGIKKPTAYLEEKTFIKAFKGHILFIYKIRNDHMEDVRIYQPQEKVPTRTIIAQYGEFIPLEEKSAVKLILRNATGNEPSFDDSKRFYKINTKAYKITLFLKDEIDTSTLGKKVTDMTISEIKKEIENMKNMGIDITPLLVGMYRKFSLAFSSLVFIFIGVPLAIRVKRREKSLGYGLSLIICLLYYLLMALGESMALRNILPAIVGVWLPNIIFLVLGLFLTYKVIED